MMQQLGQYVVTLTAVSFVSGILLSLFQDGAVRSILRFVCGVFLTVTALSPLTDITIPDLTSFVSDYLTEAEAVANTGKEMADAETMIRIEEALEAYILDKAALMGAKITAEVNVNSEGYPVAGCMTGMVSETVKEEIQAMITEDLGIPKENQSWTGEN